jgi:hypothetical protein
MLGGFVAAVIRRERQKREIVRHLCEPAIASIGGIHDRTRPSAKRRQTSRERGSTEQRAALRGGAGVIPGPLESLGAHYDIGNRKIATMFASDRSFGKALMGGAGRWNELEG